MGALSDHWQESILATFQLVSVYHWAKLSDVVDRRPLVLLGTNRVSFMTFLFGFPRNLTPMLIPRSYIVSSLVNNVFCPPDILKNGMTIHHTAN